MKFLFPLILCLSTPAVAWGALEFSAFVESQGKFQFVITDLSSGTKSGWIPIGGAFQGHTVSGFDREREVLILNSASGTVHLQLKTEKVRSGNMGRDEITKRVLDNMKMLFSKSSQYFLEKRVTEVRFADLMAHFKLSSPASVDGEDYSTLHFRQGQVLTITTRSGIEVDCPVDWKARGWKK